MGYLESGQNQVELLRLRPCAFHLCQGLGTMGVCAPEGVIKSLAIGGEPGWVEFQPGEVEPQLIVKQG